MIFLPQVEKSHSVISEDLNWLASEGEEDDLCEAAVEELQVSTV